MKRGQITVFIVVGIIILFAVGLLLYVASIRPELQLFALQETEIERYIGSCLELTAEEAITLIGNTGGHIDVPESIKINERAHFAFAKGIEPKIPLWYYNGQFKIPLKSDIEKRISDYIINNIDDCIGTFDILKDRFEFRKTGNTAANTTIEENRVFIQLSYPLEAKERLTGAALQTVPIGRNIDVKLGKIYDMAIDVLRTESKTLFFENLTMDLLSTSPDFPLTDMDFTCSPKTWRKSQIISFSKNMLYYNMQQVTVKGNRFTLFDQNNQFSKNNYQFQLSRQYSDIVATFFSPKENRLELHARPNDRELMRSNVGRPLGRGVFASIPFCINTYHFTYDIEYPILVTLNDETAFTNRGFIFNFAFPVTINHNQGDKSNFPLTLFEAPEFNYDFCTTTSNKEVDIRVVDYFTGAGLYQAPVEFRCIRYTCSYGATRPDGGVYRLRTKIPSACSGGTLNSNPEGYIEGSVTYEGEDSVEIPVKPLKTFKLKFAKYDTINLNKSIDLEKVDSVSMVVRSTSDPSLEQYYVTGATSDEMQLVEGPGDYYIEAYLIQDGQQLIGGYVGDWKVSYSDLAGKDELAIKLAQIIPIPVTEEQQGKAIGYLQDDQSYKQILKPTFS